MAKPRYLVTGGGGFIGSNIAEALIRQGERVRVLDDFSTGGRSRTGLFSSEADRLYVAVSAATQTPAHVLVIAPQ